MSLTVSGTTYLSLFSTPMDDAGVLKPEGGIEADNATTERMVVS